MAEEMLAPADGRQAYAAKSTRLEPGFGLRDAGHFAPAAIKRGLRETSRIAQPR